MSMSIVDVGPLPIGGKKTREGKGTLERTVLTWSLLTLNNICECDVSMIWLHYAIFILQICCLYAFDSLDDHKPCDAPTQWNVIFFHHDHMHYAYGPSNIIEDITPSYSYAIMCFLGGTYESNVPIQRHITPTHS